MTMMVMMKRMMAQRAQTENSWDLSDIKPRPPMSTVPAPYHLWLVSGIKSSSVIGCQWHSCLQQSHVRLMLHSTRVGEECGGGLYCFYIFSIAILLMPCITYPLKLTLSFWFYIKRLKSEYSNLLVNKKSYVTIICWIPSLFVGRRKLQLKSLTINANASLCVNIDVIHNMNLVKNRRETFVCRKSHSTWTQRRIQPVRTSAARDSEMPSSTRQLLCKSRTLCHILLHIYTKKNVITTNVTNKGIRLHKKTKCCFSFLFF